MRLRRRPEIITGMVSAAGALTACSDPGVSVTKGSAGVFTIYFPASFRLLSMTGSTTDQTAGVFSYSPTIAAPGAQVFMMTSTTAAGADRPFAFIAVGVQT